MKIVYMFRSGSSKNLSYVLGTNISNFIRLCNYLWDHSDENDNNNVRGVNIDYNNEFSNSFISFSPIRRLISIRLNKVFSFKHFG